jgi:hypothetical protein
MLKIDDTSKNWCSRLKVQEKNSPTKNKQKAQENLESLVWFKIIFTKGKTMSIL